MHYLFLKEIMIILASAKTMNESSINNSSEPIFINKADLIRTKIQKLSKDELATYFKIKGKTLETTYNFYQNDSYGKVIPSLNGAVFKEIKDYDYNYISKNIYILDAMYGILNGNDKIKLFRLDFNTKSLLDSSYYNYWKDDVIHFINSSSHEQLLVLTSEEYTKLIDLNVIEKQIFKLEFSSEIKSSVHKKQIRGKIANCCMNNNITDYNELANVVLDDYQIIIENRILRITYKGV